MVRCQWLAGLAHGRARGYNEAGEKSPFLGVQVMVITVDAVYENGVLKPVQQLPFMENETVQVIVSQKTSPADQTYGLMGWTGDHETLQRILDEAEELEELS
jgi:predicted DNA-binding antitoxin AbrB/MazE fold protein